MDQHNMDNLENVDQDVLNGIGLSALDKEILPTQMHEGEYNNLSEEIPEIVPRITNTHESNKNEVGLNEEEKNLRLSKFPEPKMRSEMIFNNLNEEERNDLEADTLHSKSFCLRA